MIDVYANVKELCEKKGMTINAVERKAGLGVGTIQKWNKVSPTVATLQQVANALGVKVTRLVREKKDG